MSSSDWVAVPLRKHDDHHIAFFCNDALFTRGERVDATPEECSMFGVDDAAKIQKWVFSLNTDFTFIYYVVWCQTNTSELECVKRWAERGYVLDNYAGDRMRVALAAMYDTDEQFQQRLRM